MKGIRGHALTAVLNDARALWMREAACKNRAMEIDPPGGFPDEQTRRAAKEICWTCPVLDNCRAWVAALPPQLQPSGITAALTEQERRGRLRKASLAQQRAAVPPGMKRCTKCGEAKPLKAYNRHRKGLHPSCKTCISQANSSRYKARRAERERLAAMTTPELITEVIRTIDSAIPRTQRRKTA